MNVSLKTRSSRRARIHVGGTYFRAKNPGPDGNNISLIAFETEPRKAKFIVTNHNTSLTENISGPAIAELLEQTLNWDERVTISNLTSTPTARYYSISEQIAPSENLGAFAFSQLFTVPGKLSVKLAPKSSELMSGSEVTIKPRFWVYDLVWLEATTPAEGEEPIPAGYSIEVLRAQMANNPWIEMLPRGYDAQDQGGKDAPRLSLFGDTYLRGGEGMPENAAGFKVGPVKSLVVLNYMEQPNGSMGVVNRVFQWTPSGWLPY